MASTLSKVRDRLPESAVTRLKKARRRLPAAPAAVARARVRDLSARVGIGHPLGPDAAECPICGFRAESFVGFGRGAAPGRGDDERRCPKCGSLERHRLIWLYLQRETDLFSRPATMLHFAPERSFSPRLAATPTLDYLTADLDPDAAMATMDITAIPRPDASYDVVCANHVLEHVPDDSAAMQEVCRVLKPGGWAILQVPMWGETTHEDPTITDPDERTRLYGQHNHVRMYGHDGEYQRRLEGAGFAVDVVDYVGSLPPDLVTRHRLRAEDLYVCTRPG